MAYYRENTLPEIDEKEHPLSPAMKALNEKQRKFVEALFLGFKKIDAARMSGYGLPDSTPNTFSRIANRMLNDPKVQAAILEQTQKLLRAEGPSAVHAIKEILDNTQHRDRLKAAAMILDRVDPATQRIDVTQTIKFDPVKTTLEEYVHLKSIGASKEVLIAEFGEHGVDRLEAMLNKQKAIEGEFKDVTDEDQSPTPNEDEEDYSDF